MPPSSLVFRPSSVFEGIWPELMARIDDLSKLTEELMEMVGAVELSGRPGPPKDELAEMLAALREAALTPGPSPRGRGAGGEGNIAKLLFKEVSMALGTQDMELSQP
jgi:hypothetical protein